MELKSLQDKKSELESAFNTLESEKTDHSKRINEINAQQLKYQGEYRLLDELIEELEANKKGTKNAK